MKTAVLVFSVMLFSMAGTAQVAVSSPRPSVTGTALTQPTPSDLSPLLNQVQQTVQIMRVDVVRLRIDKWKTDGATKRQSQGDADSIARNLNSALPTVLDRARVNSQSLAAVFGLYRNLNALSDVLTGLAQSAGAFGPQGEYEALAGDANQLDKLRHTLGDRLEAMTVSTDYEMSRLRAQAAAQAAVATAATPKKIVVDDDKPKKKTMHKHVVKKSPTATPPATGSGSATAPASTAHH